MSVLLALASSFFVIGISAYGGGVTTISLIHHEIVVVHEWLSAREMTEIITVAQMTPGPIAVNAATFVGYRVAGLMGSVIATAAVVSPAIVLLTGMTLIVRLLPGGATRFPIREAVKPGVMALIFYAVVSFGETAVDSVMTAVIALVALAVSLLFGKVLHPIFIVLGAGAVGMLVPALLG